MPRKLGEFLVYEAEDQQIRVRPADGSLKRIVDVQLQLNTIMDSHGLKAFDVLFLSSLLGSQAALLIETAKAENPEDAEVTQALLEMTVTQAQRLAHMQVESFVKVTEAEKEQKTDD